MTPQDQTQLREELERLSLDYHKAVEGEYGCPGVTCPGVQRLIAFAERVVRAAEALGCPHERFSGGKNTGTCLRCGTRRHRTDIEHPWIIEDTSLHRTGAGKRIMAKYRKKPVIVEATQWFKNGDHPDDGTEVFPERNTPGMPSTFSPLYSGEYAGQRLEGKVVRYFRRPDVSGEKACEHCGQTMHVHGWIDTLEGGHIVCPGDWIITGVKGEFYPCKPDIFAATYEPAEGEASVSPSSEGCAWSLDDVGGDGIWETQCRQSFYFDGGDGPLSHSLRWCGFCGKPLSEVRTSDLPDPPASASEGEK